MQWTRRLIFANVPYVAALLAIGLLLTMNWRNQLAIKESLQSQGAAWVGINTLESDLVPNVVYIKPITDDIQRHEQFRVIELHGYDVTPQCIERLTKPKHIESLYFISCKLCDEDFVHLPQTDVTNLLFWNADISDLAIDRISKMRGLKTITFKATTITPLGIAKLQSLLPEAEIVSVP